MVKFCLLGWGWPEPASWDEKAMRVEYSSPDTAGVIGVSASAAPLPLLHCRNQACCPSLGRTEGTGNKLRYSRPGVGVHLTVLWGPEPTLDPDT